VLDSGFPIRIPVGAETLGRIINVIGEPIDERGPIPTDKLAAIHADAPEFVEMSVEQEILVTGIKVVDLLAPYAKGGKIGKILYIAIRAMEMSDQIFFNNIIGIVNHLFLLMFILWIILISCIRSFWWCWSRQNCTHYGTDQQCS